MREVFQFLPDEEIKKISVRQQLEARAITPQSFASLPPEEQTQILNILFETYAAKTNIAKSLCGLEYLTFALAKLFFKHVVLAELTPEEQAFMDRLRAIVENHEVSLIGAENKYLDYIETGAIIAQQNRAEYRQRKSEIVQA